ncbi:MAG: hypothetical protein J1F67_07430 [Muribaculaceae bacterium]|nr:hypothetical protein [Muribaculaceae bacterium]
MFVAPSNSDSRSNKDFFLQLKEFSDFQAFKFTKTSIACSIYQPSNKSKYWFTNISEPDKCRSLDFSFLILHDMGQWKNSKQTPVNKIISSALPVIPESKDSAVIMHAGPLKRNSFFRDEFKVAKEALSGFTHISVPWYHNPSNIYRFDFPEDKIKFYNNLIKYRNRKSFPHYPNANVKYLYSLWLRGLPLEAIYWYASETSFYKSLAIFNNLYPSG